VRGRVVDEHGLLAAVWIGRADQAWRERGRGNGGPPERGRLADRRGLVRLKVRHGAARIVLSGVDIAPQDLNGGGQALGGAPEASDQRSMIAAHPCDFVL